VLGKILTTTIGHLIMEEELHTPIVVVPRWLEEKEDSEEVLGPKVPSITSHVTDT